MAQNNFTFKQQSNSLVKQVIYRRKATQRNLQTRAQIDSLEFTKFFKKKRKQKPKNTLAPPTDDSLPIQEPNNYYFYDGAQDLEEEEDRPYKRALPVELRFFDAAKIFIKGGDGGDGCVAWRREKFIPRGGPAGGNGGHGGNVWAVANQQITSLKSFMHQVHHKAEPGGRGSSSSLTGARGEDMTIQMPVGTVVKALKEDGSHTVIAELLKDGQKALLAQGGRGGRGNESFKSQRNTAPRMAENGQQGTEYWADIEMRLIADVGVIGLPNAGKSTYLASVSDAKPKIANYPFTTLVPNLGIQYTDFDQVVYADVPGLIEGASEGVGLGHNFLRHCKRCRVLIHILDGSLNNPVEDFKVISQELESFDYELSQKKQIVVYNKIDIPEAREFMIETSQILMNECNVKPNDIYAISAATGEGILELTQKLRETLKEIPRQLQSEFDEEIQETMNVQKLLPPVTDLSLFDIEIIRGEIDGDRIYKVTGAAIERVVSMGNFAYYDTVKRFQRTLEMSGINRALKKMGIQNENQVQIGNIKFNWFDDKSETTLYGAFLQGKNKPRKIAM